MKNNIFFDLDGTLIDPAVGITSAVSYALRALQLPALPLETLKKFIGPPLEIAFQKYAHMDAKDTAEAISLFRVYFSEEGIKQQLLYPGTFEMLNTLLQADKKLYIATSKPTVYARKILEGHGILSFFIDVQGGTLGYQGLPKQEAIQMLLDRHGITPTSAIMVGDRSFDIEGARQTGLFSVGVLFGYGGRRELEEAGAEALVEDPAELCTLLLDL